MFPDIGNTPDPIPLPTADIFDTPTVCVEINEDWQVVLSGVIAILEDVLSWDVTSDDDKLRAQANAETLANLIGNAVECVQPVMTIPVGTIVQYGGSTPPTGWLVCDGSSLARSGTYADLYSVIGTSFGSADGTHFNLPDFRDKFPKGLSATSESIGTTGGEAQHTLTQAEMPVHRHFQNVWNGVTTGAVGTLGVEFHARGGGATQSLQETVNQGSGDPHENRPPFLALKFIIKYQSG